MNSFTIPLNPEETRHATYQGLFKWFINSMSKKYDDAFAGTGVFTAKQLNRMADAKLLTEITHAMIYGITTTTKASLDKLYKEFDSKFEREAEIRTALESGLDSALFGIQLAGTPLAKPLNFYSLVLAVIHHESNLRVPGNFDLPQVAQFEHDERAFNLSVLADALDSEKGVARARDDLTPFASAAKDRTNVADQRATRFKFFLAALEA